MIHEAANCEHDSLGDIVDWLGCDGVDLIKGLLKERREVFSPEVVFHQLQAEGQCNVLQNLDVGLARGNAEACLKQVLEHFSPLSIL